jgi:mannose-6-phosphate isomerase-like protein (cupin superfamily)
MKIIKDKDKLWEAPSHEDKDDPVMFKKVFADNTVFPEKLKIQMINRAKIDPGKAFTPHYHEDMFEIFMLEGDSTAIINDKKMELNKYDCIIVEPNEVHILENNTNEVLYYWVIGASQMRGGNTITLNK